jgi:WD40 repeat protein
MVFSSDGETVYTSDTIGNIYHWDMSTGRVLDRYLGLKGSVYTIALSPDEHYLVSVGFSQDALIYDLTFPSEPHFLSTDLMNGTWRVRFATDGQSIIAGGPFNAERLDVVTGETTQRYSFDLGILDFAFSPDNAFIFASVADPTLPDEPANYLFDAVTGEMIRGYEGHTDRGNHVAYSPDGTRVASSSWDGTARVWDAATGEPLVVYGEHTDVTASVAFSPDGETILTTSADGTARLWDADTGETLQIFDDGAHSVVLVGVFSPDGQLILTTNVDGFAHVWDVQTGERLHTLVGHTAAIWAGTFSPDGSMIATAGDGVRLWDTQTGALIRVMPAMNKGGESWPAFSPDGQWLAVGSMEDGQVLLWRVSFEDVIAATCAHPWLDITPEERAQYGILDDAPSCSQVVPIES